MDTLFVGVFLPNVKIRLHGNFFHTVQRHHIEIPDRFVVLRRISCCHDDPAFRNRMISEGLALQKLEHRRGQSLGHAVDLINEKNSL